VESMSNLPKRRFQRGTESTQMKSDSAKDTAREEAPARRGSARGRGVRGVRVPQAELWRLLEQCSRSERQKLLRQFSESQRRALERWILSHPKGDAKKHAASCKKRCRASPRSLSGVPGIESHLRQGKLRYRAVVRFGPFRIMTGYCEDLLLAKQRLQVLREICGEAPEASSGPEVLEGLRKAVEQAKNSELELRFFALLPCRQKTPCLRVEGLEAGIRAWQELRTLLMRRASSPQAAWSKAQGICNELWAYVNGGRKRVVKRREAPKNFAQRHAGHRASRPVNSNDFKVRRLLSSWQPIEKSAV